jgi:rare lipoprotein A
MIYLKPGVFLVWITAWIFLIGCSANNQIRLNPDKPKIDLEEVEERKVRKSVDFSPVSDLQTIETGIASWYGGQFHGRRTANGEIYNMNRLTAAHRSLPFNSIVEVVNLNNRKKIIVRINDRGPFVKNRIIDLSFKAARILEMAEKGIAPVELRIIKTSELNRNPNGYDSGQGYYLQAGAFSKETNARDLLVQLNGGPNRIKFGIHFRNGFYKILSQKFNSRREAERWYEILTEDGFDLFIKEDD